MSNIAFTKEMGNWITESCKKIGITKTALGTTMSHSPTFYCAKRSVISEDNWKETVAFFAKRGVAWSTKTPVKHVKRKNAKAEKVEALVKPPTARTPALVVTATSNVRRVAAVFRVHAQFRALLNELPEGDRQEVMNELFAPEA